MNIKVLATIISKTCVSSPAVRMNLDFVFLNLAEAGAVNSYFSELFCFARFLSAVTKLPRYQGTIQGNRDHFI